jgi:hypothetical protein
MPEHPQASPTNPSLSSSDPLERRFQNYFTLRQKLNTEIVQQAMRLAVPLVMEENLPLLIDSAAQTVSQRLIKFLPKKDALTREDISSALVTAFDELARKQDWLDSTLSRKKRQQLAASVAAKLQTDIPQNSLQQALAEQAGYKTYTQETLADRDEVIQAVQTDLDQANVDKETAKKVAEEVTESLDRKALHLGASPTPAVAAAVDLAIERHAPDLSPEEHLAVASAVLQGEGGKKLHTRYEAVGEASDDIKAIFDRHKTFSQIVREEVEKDVVLSIADESQDRKSTVVHLKAPLRLGKNLDIEIRKLELHNRTQEADPNLPQNSAMPLFRYGTRIAKPKTATLDTVESFTIFDPETKKRITITKDKLDLKSLQKIDRRAFEKLSFLFDEKNLKGFENTYRWVKNPGGEALRAVTRPVTTRVRSGVSALTKPLRNLVSGATAPLRGAVQRTTDAVKSAVGKATTPVRQAMGKAVSFVTSPIKKATQRLAMKGVQLAAKVLIKLGLGGVVKKIEQLALAGSVVGIPILIAQELVTRGLGKLGKTAGKLIQDWKQVFREGLQDPLRGAVHFIGTGVDTLGAGIGGVTVGAIGTAGGALLGAAIGSLVPVVGTIIGGIVGGVAGGIFGAGYGAKQGYELRRKIQKKLLIILGMKALGLNPFNIAWALLKAGGIWVVGKIAPFLQTVLSRAVTGARGLFGIVKLGPQLLAQQAAAGEGLFAQTLRGVGNLLGRIPSTIARGFNTATGWTSGYVYKGVNFVETVFGNITVIDVPSWLANSPLMVFGLIGAFALITYTVLITVFHVTPTDVIPFVEAGPQGTRYIGITKIACVGALCSEDHLNLEPASTGGPYTIQYTISIEAREGTLTNVRITDTYAAFGDNNPPTPPPEEWDGGLTIPDGTTWEQTLTLTIPRSSQWNDAALNNVVSVTANVPGESTPVSNSESVLICFGECPVCPPSGDPIAPPFGFNQPFIPGSHTGVDLGDPPGTPIFSTFPCQAVVVYAGWDNYDRGQFGYYVALQSAEWYTFSVHMNGEPLVSAGNVVGGGTVLGFIDADWSGNTSGPHIHYEIREGPEVNPTVNWQPTLARDPCSFGVSCP